MKNWTLNSLHFYCEPCVAETERIRLSNEVIGVIPSPDRSLTKARDSVVILKQIFSDLRENTQLLESDGHFNLELFERP